MSAISQTPARMVLAGVPMGDFDASPSMASATDYCDLDHQGQGQDVLAERAASIGAALPGPDVCVFCRRGRGEVIRLVVLDTGAICGECIGAALLVLRVEVARAPRLALPVPSAAAPVLQPGGVTGDMCDGCGNFRMIRTGTCTTCLDCGTTGGCG